jgi:hypothetical protein
MTPVRPEERESAASRYRREGEPEMLTINDTAFTVSDATLFGVVNRSGEVGWNVEIVAQDGEFGGASVTPRLYIEKYVASARSMTGLFAGGIQIPSGADFCDHKILPGCKLCCFYLAEHDFLDDNAISFRLEAGQLHIDRRAKRAGAMFGDIVVVAEAQLEFLGINLSGLAEDELASKLKFDRTGLSFYEDGGETFLVA